MKFLALKLFSHFLNVMPNRLVLFLGDGLGFLWATFIPIRTTVVKANLRLAFGQEKSEKQIAALNTQILRHIGRVVFEAMRSIVWSREKFAERAPFLGKEHVEPYLKEGRGGFFVSLHLGCWELAPGSASAHGVPVDVVTKYARKPGADQLLNWFRKRLDIGIIPETKSTELILDTIKRGRWIGFMLDQFMGPPVGIPVKFFGQIAGTTASLAVLSEKHDIPCLLAYAYRNEKGIVVTVIEPFNFPQFSEDFTTRVWEKTQFINNVLEQKVRQYPSQWMWLHRRWKPFNGVPKWNLPAAASDSPVLTEVQNPASPLLP